MKKKRIKKEIYKPPCGNKFTLYGVRFFDLIFMEELAKHFKCFTNSAGKINGICTRYAVEIVRRLECLYYEDIEDGTLKSIFYKIFLNINKVTEVNKVSFKSRLIQKTKKTDPSEVKNAIESVKSYFNKVKKKFKEDSFFYYSNNILPVKDLLLSRYQVLKVGTVICLDTTTRSSKDGSDTLHVLFVMDLATRYIPCHICSRVPITGEVLASFLNDFVVDYLHKDTIKDGTINTENVVSENGEILIKDYSLHDVNCKSESKISADFYLLHQDGAGSNLDLAVRKVCFRYNIRISVASQGFANQVIERANRTFWNIAAKLCIDGLNNVSLLSLPEQYQDLIVSTVFNWMNINPDTTACELIHNLPPVIKKQIYSIYVYPYHLVAKNGTEEGNFVIKSHSYVALNFKNIRQQDKLKKEKGINIMLAELPEEFKKRQQAIMLTNPTLNDIMKIIDKDLERSEKSDKLLNTMCVLEDDQILEFLVDYIKKFEDIDPEFKIIRTQLDSVIIQLQVRGNKKLDQITENSEVYTDELQESNKNWNEDLKIITTIAPQSRELLVKEYEAEVVERKEIDLQLVKRNITKDRQNKPKDGIFYEDFLVIFDSIRSNQRYVLCRDKIAHTILYYTGSRLSYLRYITFGQLNKFFNYQDLIIQLTDEGKKLQLITIPVVKTAKNIIELARPFWNELVQILSKNGIIIDDNYNPYNVKESELWGSSKNNKLKIGLSGEQLTRRMNNQLKAPGMALSKRLNTHSYRRGLAITVGKTNGIVAAKKILNHTNISSTQVYLESEISRKELINLYNTTHNCKKLKEFEKINFDKLSNEEFNIKIEEILQKDEILEKGQNTSKNEREKIIKGIVESDFDND